MQRPIQLAAAVACILVSAKAAQARFVDGYLAQCTAVAAGTCTENTASGYARQPIGFSTPIKAVSVNTSPYTFGSGGIGSIAGHAVYDAPTGGNLVEVLPIATAQTFSASNPDAADIGALSLTYTALASYYDGGAYIGSVAIGGAVGTMADGSAVTSGSGMTIWRGLASPVIAATDPAYRVVTQTTGFAAVVPAGVTTYVVAGAGTKAKLSGCPRQPPGCWRCVVDHRPTRGPACESAAITNLLGIYFGTTNSASRPTTQAAPSGARPRSWTRPCSWRATRRSGSAAGRPVSRLVSKRTTRRD